MPRKGNGGKICRPRQSVPGTLRGVGPPTGPSDGGFPFHRNIFSKPPRHQTGARTVAWELLRVLQHCQGTSSMDSTIQSIGSQHPLQRLHATPVIPSQSQIGAVGLPNSPIEPESAVKIGQVIAGTGRGQLLNKLV
jgi:hypothetical protein